MTVRIVSVHIVRQTNKYIYFFRFQRISTFLHNSGRRPLLQYLDDDAYFGAPILAEVVSRCQNCHLNNILPLYNFVYTNLRMKTAIEMHFIVETIR
jgi:hypothetical protein